MLKTYKYRIYPDKKQKVLLSKHFGCNRFIYNWGLSQKIKSYEKTKKSPSCIDLMKQLLELKKNKIWLKNVYSQMLPV
jgi:putative transposase